jgi:N-acetylmuramoyl-L-alanine amidase
MMEKDVALEIAQRLRDVIHSKRRGARVSLTRDRDEFVPLEERPRIAKRAGADLFISIHLNANAVERVSGIETYFLNPAQDDGSMRVAARENATSETRVGALNTILFDLMRDANILESSRLARQLQAALVGELRPNYAVRNLGVKQAPFMVLIGSEMPSVLVETGFITNRQESRRFRTDAYLNRIARGIYAGLADYIEGETLARLPPAPVKVATLDNG